MKLTGIEQAIKAFGTQTALAQAVAEASGDFIDQPRISLWYRNGYVPDSYARYVAKVSGIAVDRLLRPKRKGNGHA